MMEARFFGAGLPGLSVTGLSGHLVVVEGADGVGRTTHIEMLTTWLESHGLAVTTTGLVRSALTRKGIEMAKEGHSFDRTTMSLFYATDLADRIENEIIPALRSGFVVLADRYVYTTMARGAVRGLPREWLEGLYGFALVPECVLYLRVEPDDLIRRTLRRESTLDYWESGRDIGMGPDLYSSFRTYQGLLLEEFDRMAPRYGFVTVDASRPVEEVQAALRHELSRRLDPMLLSSLDGHDPSA